MTFLDRLNDPEMLILTQYDLEGLTALPAESPSAIFISGGDFIEWEVTAAFERIRSDALTEF